LGGGEFGEGVVAGGGEEGEEEGVVEAGLVDFFEQLLNYFSAEPQRLLEVGD
jgi:hypothetical protein